MSKGISKYITITLLATFIIASVHGQQEWKLIKDKNDIQVFTLTDPIPGMDTFKGVTILNADISSFVAILSDIDNFSEWGYSIKSTELLKKEGDTMLIYYSIGKAPFPFDNRDGIYQYVFKWIADSSILNVNVDILSEYLEEKQNLVRVSGHGFWKVKVLDSENIELTFQMSVNPGGKIPAWLSNMFIDVTPYNTLTNLRKAIKAPKYQNINYDFIR